MALTERIRRPLQLAGVGYILRLALWKRGIDYKEITPNQGKKFLTGGGKCDKNLILKEVYKRYRGDDGLPIDVNDDNVADAINFNMIGRAVLGWSETSNAAQADVITALTGAPKIKVRKTKKSKIPKAA